MHLGASEAENAFCINGWQGALGLQLVGGRATNWKRVSTGLWTGACCGVAWSCHGICNMYGCIWCIYGCILW